MERERPPTDAAGPDPDSRGGVGGTRVGRASLADLRLYAYALRQGWDVSGELKGDAERRMRQILKDDKAGARSWVAAARTAVAMTATNLASIDTAIRSHQAVELAAEVEALKAQMAAMKEGQP